MQKPGILAQQKVKWTHLYIKNNPPLWYRVETISGTRYILMVDMDGTLVSLPYFSYAMLTGKKPENVSENVSFILKDGKFSCSDLSVKWQVRMLRPVSEYVESHKVVSWLPLQRNAEEQMAALSSNIRRKIRKAENNGVIVEVGGPELSGCFYSVYSQNMHRLGAPSMSRSFYRRVVESFGNGGRFVVARYKGNAIGGAVLLRNGGATEACWFATLEDYNCFYTSYLLWWECIKLSCNSGCKVFSFGRSTRGTGSHIYKSQWGTRDTTLFWSYSCLHGNDVYKLGPFRFVMADREILAKLWKLSPCFIVRWLGPIVAGKFY